MYRYLLIICSLIVFSASAQDNIKIKGKVTDNSSKEPVPFVHIYNPKTNTGTFTDLYGQFSITSAVGDTILFSAVGYAKYSLVLKEDLEEVYLEINLDTQAMELKPVRVFAYRDLESLKRAIVNMDLPAQEKKGLDLNLPKVTAAPSVTNDGTMGGGVVMRGALSGAINALGLNKKYNELQKLEKLRMEDRRKKLADAKYNAEVVRRWTGLEGKSLDSFMEFCQLNEDFVIDASEYELAVAVHQCLGEYREEQLIEE